MSEKRRLEAIEYADRELRAMYDHFNGDHGHCNHDLLPTTHPVLDCPAQRAALAKHLDGIIGHIPDILTPFGLLDINSVEVSSLSFVFMTPSPY